MHSKQTISATARPTQTTPRGIKAAVIAGFLVVLTTFGGFGTWAALAPLAGAVIAPGVVTVDSKRKAVQHPDGGVVDALLVRDGDPVTAGEVLMRLDETAARVSLAVLRDKLTAARATRARLRAERDRRPTISFPDSLASRQGEPKVDEILRGERLLFQARRESMTGEVAILEQSLAQLSDEIRGLEAQGKARQRQSALIEEELVGLRKLYEKGYAPKTRLLALEREQARLEGEHGQQFAEIARVEKAMGETRLQVIQINRTSLEAVVAELRAIETEIYDLEEQVVAAQNIFDRIEIRAPATGSVVGLDVFTVGGVIAPGDTVLEIVPANDRLVVEAQVRPVDIDSLFVGQGATVRLPAFKQRSTPTLNGRVTRVSADRIVEEQSGQPYYLVRIEIAEAEVRRLGEKRLTPGMPTEVMIETASRTALDYLAQPLLDSVARAWREE